MAEDPSPLHALMKIPGKDMVRKCRDTYKDVYSQKPIEYLRSNFKR